MVGARGRNEDSDKVNGLGKVAQEGKMFAFGVDGQFFVMNTVIFSLTSKVSTSNPFYM
jgi:hypothetical protein